MFTAASPSVPSFGDRAWHAPVVASSDPGAAWALPVPVLAPTGGPSRGQTLTGGANGAINTTAPFAPLVSTPMPGDRLLVTADGGVTGSAGLWQVVASGGISAPFVLVRPADWDAAGDTVDGSMVNALEVMLDGVTYTIGAWMFSGGSWFLSPRVLDELFVETFAQIGTGLLDPALSVLGSARLDSISLDYINQDVGLVRHAAGSLGILSTSTTPGDLDARTATLHGDLSVAGNLAATGTLTWTDYTPVLTGFGTATFLRNAGRWARIGDLILLNIRLQVNAVGAGGGVLGIGIPVAADISDPDVVSYTLTLYSTMTVTGVGAGLINGAGSATSIDRIFVGSTTMQRTNLAASGSLLITGWYKAA